MQWESARNAPRWQEGSHEFEIAIPVEGTGGGEDKTVRVGISWKVSRTRLMNAREKTLWEIDRAQHEMAIVRASLNENQEEMTVRQVDGLHRALLHACWAWCRTHLRCKDARQDNEAVYSAFFLKAPEDLRQAFGEAFAMTGWNSFAAPWASTAEVMAAVQSAVDALLEAASNPPRNRRRFPASFRTNRPIRMPRVGPGSMIDTGRYRPAVVLETTPDPPHVMKLSYGDEVDEDFRPHISNWKSVRKRKRLPSLKDVFSPGDWIRHPYSGFGRVVEVRNSTMDVDYRGRAATVAPPADLSRLEKVDDPGPEDSSPVAERFPPGTWIEQDSFGQGVVLAVEDDVLSVLFNDQVIRIFEPGDREGPVIWRLDREPLDLCTPWGRRWVWWWQHTDICPETVCPCCGYPNFGSGGRSVEPRECIICGYPDFGSGIECDDEPLVVRDGIWWEHIDDYYHTEPEESEPTFVGPTRRDWETSGYSLREARRNFEDTGSMFRPGDDDALAFGKSANLRRSLVGLLEETMAEPARWNAGIGESVERVKQKLLKGRKKGPAAPPNGSRS